jgi:hypothetical protein
MRNFDLVNDAWMRGERQQLESILMHVVAYFVAVPIEPIFICMAV